MSDYSSGSATIEASAEAIFAILKDLGSYPQWSASIKSVEIAEKDGTNYACVVVPMMWRDQGVGAIHVTRFPAPLRLPVWAAISNARNAPSVTKPMWAIEEYAISFFMSVCTSATKPM